MVIFKHAVFSFLVAGAVFVSLGLFHVFSTGVSMFLIFVMYTIASAIVPCLGEARISTLEGSCFGYIQCVCVDRPVVLPVRGDILF